MLGTAPALLRREGAFGINLGLEARKERGTRPFAVVFRASCLACMVWAACWACKRISASLRESCFRLRW